MPRILGSIDSPSDLPHPIPTELEQLAQEMREEIIGTVALRGGQIDGLHGYLRRDESLSDKFGASHASTSISAALGMAVEHGLAAVLCERCGLSTDAVRRVVYELVEAAAAPHLPAVPLANAV